MTACFATRGASTPVHVVLGENQAQWCQQQSAIIQQWMKVQYRKEQSVYLLPDSTGQLHSVLFLLEDKDALLAYAALFDQLPYGQYELMGVTLEQYHQAALAWVMAAYRFTHYRASDAAKHPKLKLIKGLDKAGIEDFQCALYRVRDLINYAPCDLMPNRLAEITKEMAAMYQAKVRVTQGKDLLKKGFPAVHAVGRASHHAPCLIELNWGEARHPKLTLVGKGVCYDTGGLSLKPTSNMLLMKKDMGGAAHVLGLAEWIMRQKLPVCLQVLIPAVDNAVGGDAYRPGDVLTMRNGTTVEVTNTDAEGRLILADALSYAAESKPDLIIDFATLTGAARVAVGTELAALFGNQTAQVNTLQAIGEQQQDPVWPMPLYQPYKKLLRSAVADCVNSASTGYAGAITAALFLEQFVDQLPWLHFDVMAWNVESQPGKPKGGEALALRACYTFIQHWAEQE